MIDSSQFGGQHLSDLVVQLGVDRQVRGAHAHQELEHLSRSHACRLGKAADGAGQHQDNAFPTRRGGAGTVPADQFLGPSDGSDLAFLLALRSIGPGTGADFARLLPIQPRGGQAGHVAVDLLLCRSGTAAFGALAAQRSRGRRPRLRLAHRLAVLVRRRRCCARLPFFLSLGEMLFGQLLQRRFLAGAVPGNGAGSEPDFRLLRFDLRLLRRGWRRFAGRHLG